MEVKNKLPKEKITGDYFKILEELKGRIITARIKASLSINKELIFLYWEIGNRILEQQKNGGWGSKVVERLAQDLRKNFPDMKGLSPRNLKYMRAFSAAWTETEKVQQLAAQIRWFHNCILLDKLGGQEEREWYVRQTIANGWSRNILEIQIENKLYERQGRAVSNFKITLPPEHSDLVQQITKAPYIFDFLAIRDDYNERMLEDGLVGHVQKFLLETGAGFAFVGRQYHLEVGGQDFYLDLLFYHLKLRCYVVIYLKVSEFTPEHAGKMNFYLSAVDDILRQPDDKPSIGIVLCKSKNKIIAGYALRDIKKPVGVSGYITKITKSLPKKFKSMMPGQDEIEKGLIELDKAKSNEADS